MFGWLVLVMLSVVAVTLIVIVGATVYIARTRRKMGCGSSREPEIWPEAELDGESLFEPTRWHERWP